MPQPPQSRYLGTISIHQTVVKIFSGTEFFGSFEKKNTEMVPSAAQLGKAPSLGACQLLGYKQVVLSDPSGTLGGWKLKVLAVSNSIPDASPVYCEKHCT